MGGGVDGWTENWPKTICPFSGGGGRLVGGG